MKVSELYKQLLIDKLVSIALTFRRVILIGLLLYYWFNISSEF